MKHKCLASMIVFLLFISLFLAIGLGQVKMLLKADNLLRILDESRLYEKVANIGKEISTSSEGETLAKINYNAFAKSIDPIWLKQTAQKNIPIIFDFLNGKIKKFSINIDLTSFKNQLGLNYPESAKEVIKSLPACAPDYVPKEGEIPNCLPPGVTVDQINPYVNSSDFTDSVSEVPKSISLNEQNQTIKNIKRTFTAINIAFLVSLILSVILIIILILLGLSYWPSIFRWVGLSLILPSGVMIILDLINMIGKGLLARQISLNGNESWSQIVIPVLNVIDKGLTRPGLIISGTIFFFGVILIILSYVFSSIAKPKPTPTPAPVPPPRPAPIAK